MSRQVKDDFLRHYTVSDPRTHPKGYTEYKVTAQFISKRDPEDVKEVVVWKRYSDFRKLHGDLAYTHRNLFRRLEEFPAFPRAQVFDLIAEGAGPSPTHIGELAAMEAEAEKLDQEPWEPGGQEEEEDEEGGSAPAYLSQATELITQALRDEKAGAYPAALQGYRDGVHILLQGVPGDPSAARREGVKKKAAEYLKRAEEILHLHLSQLPP
ncbi:PREDICTED: sorting nexin-15 [Hipposideros armiger]|uniref:Sorting nexin-15 n=1 Tax=Hipposideros armiger TaxID=186990 RepID=A0A8B7RIP7_HIPAR|nr:PREDICTED: sorting nexin-15 [Hipposideros armiger]